MNNDVKLNSPEWTDLVFEGKNKSYGAYHLRRTSWKGYVVGIISVILFMLVVIFLPSVIERVKLAANKNLGNIETTVEFADIKALEEQKQEENIIRETQPVEPPPKLKATIKFTPPVITEDENVKEDEEMISQKDLNETKVQVSVFNNLEGSEDEDAVDMATLQENKNIVAEESQEVFFNVEQKPQFPGGDKALLEYLHSSVKYPQVALENGIQGKVVVKFVVNADGSVGDIEILMGVDRVLNEEAIRVVKSMPKWSPGRQNGKAVRVYYNVPIDFKISN